MPSATKSNANREKPAPEALTLWLVTDNKPGHRNQLQGLADRLAAHVPISVRWIEALSLDIGWQDFLLRRWEQNAHSSDTPEHAPDIVIGAGHRTHKAILTAKRHFRCFSAVLMKPSLPLRSFDAAIIPAHDAPPERNNVLVTEGVLNTIIPASSPAETNQHLVLVGGESKHYHWNTQDILKQIEAVAATFKEQQVILTDSRRTPEDFATALLSRLPENVSYIPHTETPSGWVKAQMQTAQDITVTPDSVSMVYEAMTSGRPVQLFSMQPRKKNRIVRGITRLLDRGLVWNLNSAREEAETATRPPLWEAERAAQWLLQRYKQYTLAKTASEERSDD